MSTSGRVGGLWAWWMGRSLQARALTLISVRGLGLMRAGDMLVDGVIPLDEALPPFCL